MRYFFNYKFICLMMVAGSFLYSRSMAQNDTTNGFGGVGLKIVLENGQLQVDSVIPGSPAEKAGIRAGDMITTINGEPTAGLQSKDVVDKIRGPEGTGIAFNVKRTVDGNEKEINFTLNRGFISSNEISTTINPPGLLNGLPTANSVLYFNPLSSRVAPGKPFQLSIVLDNPKGINADDLGLWVQYNPQATILLSTKAGSLFELESTVLSGWTLVTTFSKSSSGELFIRLKAKDEGKILSGKLGTLEFQATGKLPVSEIYFRFNNSWGEIPNTFIKYKDKDVLGKEIDHADGAISETVRVLREDQIAD